MNKWIVFIKERFEPASHFAMILLLVLGHILVARALDIVHINHLQYVFLGLATTFFFLKLRFYDEIKDYETDLKLNPTRPLPRGLVTHHDLHMGIILCIILELLFFLFCSVNGFLLALTAVLYSLLMFKEFFIPQHIRPYLTTYAVSHTVVTVLLSLTMFAALSGVNITQLPSDAFKYALVTWFLFNIFEFGRKTFLLSEEREDVPSYSNIFGKHGAFFLVLSQAFLAYLLTVSMNCFVGRFIPIFMTLIMVPLIFLGVLFVVKTDGPWGKLYRHFSSVYIILFYVGVLCFLF